MSNKLVDEAKARLRTAISRGGLGERRNDVHFVLDYLDALEKDLSWEWGVRWNGVETVAHSEAMARKWYSEDPEGTTLLKRRAAGDWVYA